MSHKSYHQHCALARALDCIGDRWSMLIVRNLLLGPQRFGQLRAELPGVAKNLLSSRLKRLTEQGVLTHEADLYGLSPQGLALESALFALGDWGERWRMEAPTPQDHVRMRYFMTSLRRKIRPTFTPARLTWHVDDASFALTCGPTPTVTQGPHAEAQTVVWTSAQATLAFFAPGASTPAWLGREDVRAQGDPSALEHLRQSF